jgi:formiminotetrahydrofolate cyclodeaminase
MTFRALALEDFNARVQAPEPTPGGGSVSAIAGAFAASLGAMAAAFSLGREDAPDLARLRADLAQASTALLELADEDARAYQAFSSAQKLPKGTPVEKSTRRDAMQHALRGAAEAPLASMRVCRDVLLRLRDLLPRSNPNLKSDVGVGAHLALAALHGARLNVEVNLAALRDPGLVEQMRGEAGRLRGEAEAAARDIVAGLDSAR